MYYEIIYTRCKYGLTNWKPSKNEGFKVYSCSSDLYKSNIVDINLLMQTIQKKLNFKDEHEAVDIYIFNRDNNKTNILNVFHTVPVDDNPVGRYDNRPGMYVNQAVVGKFENIYPYELFGDTDIFTMTTKPRAFFYAEEQQELDIPVRQIESKAQAKYTPEIIKQFIDDGRLGLLKKAVSFIMSQKQSDVRRPKNLVIRDSGVEKIELWIAAIESAFSPRAASGITFAVKYDDYKLTKPYFDIIGFNSLENPQEIKNTDQSSYVVLDGIKKEIYVSVSDDSNDYLNLVTSFSKDHLDFVKGFLNSFGLYDPSPDVLKVYDSYKYLIQPEYKNTASCAKALKSISSYEMFQTEDLKNVYNIVKSRLDFFIKDDIKESLGIVAWLQKAAEVFNDVEMGDKVNNIIVSYVKNILFKNYKEGNFKEFCELIKDSSCFDSVKKWLAKTQTIDSYESVMAKFSPEDYVEYYEAVCDDTSDEKLVLSRCIKLCDKKKEKNSFKKVLEIVDEKHKGEAFAFLVESVVEYETDSIPYVLDCYLDQCSGARALEKLLNEAIHTDNISNIGKETILRYIDSKLDVSDHNMYGLAEKLQKTANGNVKLINTAHVMANRLFDDVRGRSSLKKPLQLYEDQGFPFVDNEQYIDDLTEKIICTDMSDDEHGYILELLSRCEVYFEAYLSKVALMCEKYKGKWNFVITYIGKLTDIQIKKGAAKIIANAFFSNQPKKKKLESYMKYITDEKGCEYYQSILNVIFKKLEENNGSSGSSGIIGKIFRR